MWVCRLPVHIDPAGCTGFTEIFGEFVTSHWADRVVGPYNAYRHCIKNSELFQFSRKKSRKTEAVFLVASRGPGGNRNPPGLVFFLSLFLLEKQKKK